MTCHSCRGRVRGHICDGCGAMVGTRPCLHLRRTAEYEGAYTDRSGLVTWRRISFCKDCDRVIPGAVVPMTASEPGRA